MQDAGCCAAEYGRQDLLLRDTADAPLMLRQSHSQFWIALEVGRHGNRSYLPICGT